MCNFKRHLSVCPAGITLETSQSSLSSSFVCSSASKKSVASTANFYGQQQNLKRVGAGRQAARRHRTQLDKGAAGEEGRIQVEIAHYPKYSPCPRRRSLTVATAAALRPHNIGGARWFTIRVNETPLPFIHTVETP